MLFRLSAATVAAIACLLAAKPAIAQVMFTSNSGGTLQLSPQGTRLQPGTNAIVSVKVEAGVSAAVALSNPIFISGPAPDPAGTVASAAAVVRGSSISSTGVSNAPLPSSTTTAITTEIPISMQVQRPWLFPAGTYTYQVVITVTVN